SRQYRLDEEVLVEDQRLAFIRTQRLENRSGIAEVFPSPCGWYRLHIGDGRDVRRVANCPMETQCRSPIMQNQYDVFGQSKSLEPSVKIARMIHEPVCVCRRLSRLTHPDQIGRETAAEFGYIGDDVAPEIGGGRIAVQEHDRLADANIDVAEFRVEH